MKIIVAMIVLAGLVGCGADGAPFAPTANLGVSVGSGGITPTASVGATNGPLTVSLGL